MVGSVMPGRSQRGQKACAGYVFRAESAAMRETSVKLHARPPPSEPSSVRYWIIAPALVESGEPTLVTVARMKGAAPECWPVDRRNAAE